jgi:hypothetical protein
MLQFFLKPALLLTLIFALPIVAIRAQPYEDRVTPILIDDDCPSPCFMGIRPGVTTMRESAEILDAHAWVANGQSDFPKELRDAPFFDAVLRKTVINWRWSPSRPAWIVGDQRGSMTIQDARVLDIGIATHFRLGEIFLAFNNPTEVYFSTSKDGQRFQYAGWYEQQGIVVITQGNCPLANAYYFPVQMIFVHDYPQLSVGLARTSVCR